jgi:hypothetical protein
MSDCKNCGHAKLSHADSGNCHRFIETKNEKGNHFCGCDNYEEIKESIDQNDFKWGELDLYCIHIEKDPYTLMQKVEKSMHYGLFPLGNLNHTIDDNGVHWFSQSVIKRIK